MRVGIIGRGWGARSQAPNFKDAGLDVIGIAGRNDWRSIIASDADIITITMPPRVHAEMAIAALEAGKHVICEKPMALDAAEASTMVAAANAHPDRIAMVDHELRFVPSFRAARERIAELGAIRYAEARYSSSGRGDRTRAWNWWSDAAEGGGVWGAVGSHFVDALLYVGLGIDAVQAVIHTTIRERSGKPVTSDDFASVHLRAGNALVTMTFSAVGSGPDEPSAITLHGEEGSFRLTGEELLFARRGEPYARVAGGELAQRPGNTSGGPFGTGTYALGLAIRRALDDGDASALAPAATFADGLAVQRVLDAARHSNREGGRWVEVTDR